MKNKMLWLALPVLLGGFLYATSISEKTYAETQRVLQPEDGCVFMTVMGEQSSKDFNVYKSYENNNNAVRDGLSWLKDAQLPSGGYGAGSHSAQHIKDPHAVKADPATTAMVIQAYLRSGTTLKKGAYAKHLEKAVNYLLETVESVGEDDVYITEVRGTQIQSKLGQNIDAVLTAQVLSNLIDRNLKGLNKKRINKCLDICVAKIEMGTDENGRQKNAGWAGVLQSGLATSALEAAQAVGADVNDEVISRSKDYQKGNYDAKNGTVKTDDGAGVMLYAISNSVRASAKDARKVKEDIAQAKKEGKIARDATISSATLKKIGYADSDAAEYSTSYEVYQSAKNRAQQEDVLTGFGNNGGEEFLSFLQTGESLVVNQDEDWKKWYDDMSGRILKIQNANGSWNGHHCITSPVFCTATSLLLLTVENDVEFLSKVGAE